MPDAINRMDGHFDNFIGGDWVHGVHYEPNINPSCTSDIIGEYAHASPEQVESALIAAAEAFPVWSRSGIQQRCEALDFTGSELLSRQYEIGKLLAREEGKTLREGIGEVVRAGQIFKFFAGEAIRLCGESRPSIRPGVRVEVTREPVGVMEFSDRHPRLEDCSGACARQLRRFQAGRARAGLRMRSERRIQPPPSAVEGVQSTSFLWGWCSLM